MTRPSPSRGPSLSCRRAPARRGFALAASLLLGASAAVTAGDAAAQGDGPAVEPPWDIHMILWRGKSQVEEGALAYFEQQGLAVDITIHDLAREPDRLPEIIETIRAAEPDLVYSWGTTITAGTVGTTDDRDPERHITDIPVVFTMVSAPIQTSIMPADGRSRANFTGVTHMPPVSAQLRTLLEFRDIDRLGVIYNPAEANSVANIETLRNHQEAFGFELIEAEVPLTDGRPDPDALPALMDRLAGADVEFLYIGPDSFVGTHSEAITEGMLARGIPAFTGTQLEVLEARAMLGLVSRYPAVGQLTAHLVHEILGEGRDPGEIELQRLQRFAFMIRMPEVRQLELYPPLSMLRYAEIIE